jgi:hypothetical protein
MDPEGSLPCSQEPATKFHHRKYLCLRKRTVYFLEYLTLFNYDITLNIHSGRVEELYRVAYLGLNIRNGWIL